VTAVVRAAIWLGVVVLITSLGLAALTLRSQAKPTGESAPLPDLAKAVAVAHVDIKGGVTPLYPLKAGQVSFLYEDALDGREVEAQQALFRLDDTVEQQQLAQAQVALEAAELRVTQAKNAVAAQGKQIDAQKAAIRVVQNDVEVAKFNHQRAQRLFREGVGSCSEEVAGAERLIRKAEAAVAAEQAKLAALEAVDVQSNERLASMDVKAKQADLDKAKYALSLCEVKAPEKGRVLRSLVGLGETLGPHPQRPALWFAPKKPLIVRAEVEQEFARYVKENDRVSVYDDPMIYEDPNGDHSWKGRVTSISGWYSQRRSILMEPLQFNDVRTLECIVELDKQPANLKIGQRVRVVLEKQG
jgi:multidrug resistance efflux pump